MSILTQMRLPMRKGQLRLFPCATCSCALERMKIYVNICFNENPFAFTCYFIKGIYKLEKKMAWLEIRASPAQSVVQSTNHGATEHVRFVHRLFMFNMKTVSVRMYTFHNCENYVKVSHDCPTKRDGSSFKILVMQQSSCNFKVAKISVMSSTVC